MLESRTGQIHLDYLRKSQMKNRHKILGIAAISTAAAAWGLDGIVLTPRLYNLDVGFVVFMLHAIPFALMNLVFYREYRHLKTFSKGDYLAFSMIALLGGAVGTLSIVKALFLVNFQSLSVVVLLQKLQPVFAITLAAILLKEKLKNQFAIWAIVALIASYFLSFGLSLPNFNTGENTPYAVLYALLAAASFGSSTVFGKMIMSKHHFTTATFFRYGFTSLVMLTYVVFMEKFDQFAQITPTNWSIFFVIGLTTGSGAIYLYYFGLKTVKASIATICELCFPLSAVIFDFLINDQILSSVQWISAIVMLFAIIRISTTAQEEPVEEYQPVLDNAVLQK